MKHTFRLTSVGHWQWDHPDNAHWNTLLRITQSELRLYSNLPPGRGLQLDALGQLVLHPMCYQYNPNASFFPVDPPPDLRFSLEFATLYWPGPAGAFSVRGTYLKGIITGTRFSVVACITTDGYLFLPTDVNPGLGLSLDSRGRVRVNATHPITMAT